MILDGNARDKTGRASSARVRFRPIELSGAAEPAISSPTILATLRPQPLVSRVSLATVLETATALYIRDEREATITATDRGTDLRRVRFHDLNGKATASGRVLIAAVHFFATKSKTDTPNGTSSSQLRYSFGPVPNRPKLISGLRIFCVCNIRGGLNRDIVNSLTSSGTSRSNTESRDKFLETSTIRTPTPSAR